MADLLTRNVVLCHAPQDADFATELGALVEANCPVTVSREQGQDVIEAVESGMSDITLVLLSPDSIPKPWKRERWEPVLLEQPKELGTEIGFLLVRECRFPELLRRKTFFDLSQDARAGQRAVKRWLLNRDQDSKVELPDERYASAELSREELDVLRLRLADQPGTAPDLTPEAALAFAHAAKDEFEGVFWIDCTGRTRAGILGDAAHALGLRLAGTVEHNRDDLREFCTRRRCLFVFENIEAKDRHFATWKGKTSAIFTSSALARPRPTRDETAALLTSWTRNTSACLHALGDAHNYLRTAPDVRLGSSMIALLTHEDRLAEAYEILERLVEAARESDDPVTLRRFAWEQSWILERWDEPVSADVAMPLFRQPKQLSLAFSS